MGWAFRKAATYSGQSKHRKKHRHYASTEIRTYDYSVWTGEGILYFRQRDHYKNCRLQSIINFMTGKSLENITKYNNYNTHKMFRLYSQ
jgi:hypothetical protein